MKNCISKLMGIEMMIIKEDKNEKFSKDDGGT
jgi:hypothetical protein